jgi:hypothetical protein
MKLQPFLRARTLCLGSFVALFGAGLLPAALLAQSQDSASVADAAHKAKDQKKANTKEARVITEETLTLRPASADTGEAPPAGTLIITTPVPPAPEVPPASADTKKTEDTASEPPAETAKPTEPSAPGTETTPAPAEPGKSTESGKPADSPAPGTDSSAVTPDTTDTQKAEEQAAEIAKTKELLAQAKTELDLTKRELALQNDTYFSNPDYAHDSAGKAKLDDLQRTIDEKQTSVQDLKLKLDQLLQEAGISPEADQPAAQPTE